MQSQGPDPMKMAMAAVALGAVGYLGYRYWYLPEKVKQDLLTRTQGGRPDALRALGSAGCMALGASYGLPPQATGGICAELMAALPDLLQQLPGFTYDILSAAGGGLANFGGGLGQGIYGLSSGVAGGVQNFANIPINVAGNYAGTVYGGGKTVVKDVYVGTKTVIKDIGDGIKSLAPWNW